MSIRCPYKRIVYAEKRTAHRGQGRIAALHTDGALDLSAQFSAKSFAKACQSLTRRRPRVTGSATNQAFARLSVTLNLTQVQPCPAEHRGTSASICMSMLSPHKMSNLHIPSDRPSCVDLAVRQLLHNRVASSSIVPVATAKCLRRAGGKARDYFPNSVTDPRTYDLSFHS
jgi:hypothetical protein